MSSMSTRSWLITRAAIAVALMVGFYAFALSIAGVLLFLAYEVLINKSYNLRLALFCVVGAGIILWSILPRLDKFEPPGIQLPESEHPLLFETLRSVADATGQAMPSEVYLLFDMNAWVSSRGGFMGFGSRRVMGIGLPLLHALTVDQFRAVIAHEFGHYHAGDIRLGPWIHKTRAALGRTIDLLSDRESILQWPFKLYAAGFLRITLAISRQQEYAADALAASAVGVRHLVDGLKRVHGAAIAYQHYLQTHLMYLMERGFSAPIMEGFVRYIGSPRINQQISRLIDDEIREGQAQPYDSHPSLRERIAAQSDDGSFHATDHHQSGDAPLAFSLVENIDLANVRFGSDGDPMPVVAWSEAPKIVWLPYWRRFIANHQDVLAGMTAGSVPEVVADLTSFRKRIAECLGRGQFEIDNTDIAVVTLGIGLALALDREGWHCDSQPGPFCFEKAGKELMPFEMTENMVSGALSPHEWRQICAEAEILDLSLEVIQEPKSTLGQ